MSLAWRRTEQVQPPGFSAALAALDELRHEVSYLKKAVRVLINDKRESMGLDANFEWDE